MKSVIAFSCMLAVASAGLVGYSPLGLGYGYPYNYNAGLVASAPVSSQYHAQDELGQYSYGYSGGPSAKSESRTADGVTRGAYQYVDANGILQSVQYVSDPVNGFRVAATNLPVAPVNGQISAPLALSAPIHIAQLPVPVDDTPEVKLAKIQHFQAHAEAAARAAL